MTTQLFPKLTAYSPQTVYNSMEGGLEASRKGIDGKAIVRTLDDYVAGKFNYVTLAGHPDWYYKKIIIPDITYINNKGLKQNLKNVRCYVHDTGSAFRGEDAQAGLRFDVPIGKDYKNSIINIQPFSLKKLEFLVVDDWPDIEPKEKPIDVVIPPVKKEVVVTPIVKPVDNKEFNEAQKNFCDAFLDFLKKWVLSNGLDIKKPLPAPVIVPDTKPVVPTPVTKIDDTEQEEDSTEETETPEKEVEKPLPDKNKTQNLPWLDTAISHLGLEEADGDEDNETIMSWAQELGGEAAKIYTADEIPWCALFIGYCMKHNDIEITDSPLWALSWRNWGKKLDEPAYGCLLVFKRTGGGHVGFYISEDDDYYHVLGGNQSNSVNITKIEKGRCVGIRWPDGYEDSLKEGRIFKTFDGKVSTNER